MGYYLTVTTKTGNLLHRYKQYDTLEAVLGYVSEKFLSDPEKPFAYSGHFAVRSGMITWLSIQAATAREHLREDIARIDIVSERGLLDHQTAGQIAN
jgi:hypothetical protein